MTKLYFFSISSLIFFTSCTPRVALINTSNYQEPIQICTNYDPMVSDNYRAIMETQVEYFIQNHNAYYHNIKVTGCKNRNDNYSNIQYYFGPTAYVGDKQNALATVGNVFGIVALPMVMASAGSGFVVFFYFWPNTITEAHVKVSDDLIGQSGKEWPLVYKTPGYFKSINKQDIKQGRMFYQTLESFFIAAERQRSKELKTARKNSNQLHQNQ